MNELDRRGPNVKDLLTSLKHRGINYNILLINDKPDQMVQEFRRIAADDLINTFSMKDGLEFRKIIESIVKQIEMHMEQRRYETKIISED